MAVDTDKFRPSAKGPTGILIALSVLAILAAVAGLLAGFAALGSTAPPGNLGWLVACIVAGLCVAGALLALAWMCGNASQQTQALRRTASVLDRLAPGPADHLARLAGGRRKKPAAGPAPVAPDASDQVVRMEMMLEQLRDLNISVLLSDEQRRQKHRVVVQRQVGDLTEFITRSAQNGDFEAAESGLDQLVRLVPDSDQAGALRERIERERANVKARDITGTSKRIEDLMAAGEFNEAQAAADDLLKRYPASAEVIGLMDRVLRERHRFLEERRGEMYARIEKEAAARHWRVALEAAREFIEAFPDGAESGAVRAQMETLSDNARIEEVRELRDRIADLIDRKRFGEALTLSRDLVERFPDTAAAAELREMMSRLENRARDSEGNGE